MSKIFEYSEKSKHLLAFSSFRMYPATYIFVWQCKWVFHSWTGIFARVYHGTLTSDRVHFVSLRSGRTSSVLPRTLVFLLLPVPLLTLGTFKEVNIHRLLLPFLRRPIQSLLCSLFFSLPPHLPSHHLFLFLNHLRTLVWSRQAQGRPFFVKHDLRRELRPDWKGNSAIFTRWRVDRVSFLREIEVAPTVGTDLIPVFQLRKAFIVDRNYPEIPSACCSW